MVARVAASSQLLILSHFSPPHASPRHLLLTQAGSTHVSSVSHVSMTLPAELHRFLLRPSMPGSCLGKGSQRWAAVQQHGKHGRDLLTLLAGCGSQLSLPPYYEGVLAFASTLQGCLALELCHWSGPVPGASNTSPLTFSFILTC